MGRLIDITGERGFIDFGIPKLVTVELVVRTHRKKRHRLDNLKRVEELIETQRNSRRMES